MNQQKTTNNKTLLAALLMSANLIGALTPIAVLATPTGYAHLGQTALAQALDTLDSMLFSRASAADYGNEDIDTLVDGDKQGITTSGSAKTIDGGTQYINAGVGTANIMNGGRQSISNGGTGTVGIMNGGSCDIESGGTSTVDNMTGGFQWIYSGGTGTVKNLNGGVQIVYDGGISKDTVLNVGGGVLLKNGGIIQNITYNGGTLSLEGVRSGYDNMQLGQGVGETNVILSLSYGSIVKDLTINSSGKASLFGVGNYGAGQLLGNTVNRGLLDMGAADGAAFVEHLSGIGGTVQVGLFNPRLGDDYITYHDVSITNLSDSQTFLINADLANNTADKIVIGNSATGEHYIKLDREATAGSELAGLTGHSATVVENAANANFSAVQSSIDGINVLPTIEHDGSGNWNLVGYTVTGASNLAMTAAGAANNAYAVLMAADNNIQRRMGELRSDQDSAGVWVRTFGGEYDVQGSTLKHTTIQGGYDKITKVSNGLSVTGLTLEHLSGSSSYAHGDGKLTNTRMGIYHSWLGDSGHYYDVVVKTGKMYNELGAYDDTKISGHYRAWNTSISAEYGYRKQLAKGYFIQPQAELTLGRINGAGYTADNGTYINQDAINSLVARAGISVGQQLERGSYYLTASVLHEFSAKSKVTTGQGAFASTIEQDLKGTALELALGGNIKMGKNNNMYLEAARSFGGKTINKWQLQAGFRGNF